MFGLLVITENRSCGASDSVTSVPLFKKGILMAIGGMYGMVNACLYNDAKENERR